MDTIKPDQAGPITVKSVEDRLNQLKNIIPKEWLQTLSEEVESQVTRTEDDPERKAFLNSLRELKFGTWFEFFDVEKEIFKRGKLAWINPTTSKHIFVNQIGRQIATKSLQELADDLEQGRAKIIDIEKLPFVNRPLKSIQKLLKKKAFK